MNRDLVIGLILLYIALGYGHSQYTRTVIARAIKKNKMELVERLAVSKRFMILNFIFNPVVSARIKFDLWLIGLKLGK